MSATEWYVQRTDAIFDEGMAERPLWSCHWCKNNCSITWGQLCKTYLPSVRKKNVFQGDHEEADTLLAFHASHTNGSLIIWASDTDVLIIILGMLGKNKRDSIPMKNIIMDCCSGKEQRYLNVTTITATLEEKHAGLAAALPGLHTFTGCDFTASFFRKGKVNPY